MLLSSIKNITHSDYGRLYTYTEPTSRYFWRKYVVWYPCVV